MRPGRWKCLGVVGATLPLWIPAPYRGTGHAFDRRNDELRGRNDERGGRWHSGTFEATKHHFRTNDTYKTGPLSLNSYSSASLLTGPNWKFILT